MQAWRVTRSSRYLIAADNVRSWLLTADWIFRACLVEGCRTVDLHYGQTQVVGLPVPAQI